MVDLFATLKNENRGGWGAHIKILYSQFMYIHMYYKRNCENVRQFLVIMQVTVSMWKFNGIPLPFGNGTL